jgi:DNA-binding SARP family transcriptional activator
VATRCAVRLLGGFAVEIDGTAVADESWRHRRGADVVKLLALAPSHRLHREQVMAALWPRALIDVDVERFESLARAALANASSDAAGAVEFAGELLPEDRYADWSEPRRANINDLARLLLRRAGRWDRILELDRTDEEAHRAIMRRHLDAGDAPAAIRQFQRLRAILRADLGVGPEPESVAIFEEALAARSPEAATGAERAQTLIARGLLAWNRRDLHEAERFAEEARHIAREGHLGRELGEACALLGLAAFAQGRWRDRFRADFADAVRLSPDDSGFVFDAHLCLAETAMGGIDAEAVASQARELIAVAESAGSPQGQALASLIVGEAELFAGRRDAARPWFVKAVALFGDAGADAGRVIATLRLCEATGDDAGSGEVHALLADASALSERSELAAHLVARVLAARINAATTLERKMAALTEAERRLRPNETCGPCSIGLWVAAAITSARGGELARARRFLADAERLAALDLDRYAE